MDVRPAMEGIVLSLSANWRQIALLVAVNAFVGGMVGLERSTLPVLAEREFGITSTTAAVSFIATFGLAKGRGACLEELEGSANVVKAASVAWRPLTHNAERLFCELDWMVDGVRE